jgi:hypothetical protein
LNFILKHPPLFFFFLLETCDVFILKFHSLFFRFQIKLGNSNTGTSVAFFPHGTYIAGGGFHPKLFGFAAEQSSFKDAFCLKPPTSLVKDTSVTLTTTPPSYHTVCLFLFLFFQFLFYFSYFHVRYFSLQIDATLANELNLVELWKSQGAQSFFSTCFFENENRSSLRDHVEKKLVDFFTQFPSGTVTPLIISPQVLKLPYGVTYECWQLNPGPTYAFCCLFDISFFVNSVL